MIGDADRAQEIQDLARSLGLAYSPSDLNTETKPPFTLFWQTVDYEVANVLLGKWKDREIEEFDYTSIGDVSFSTGGPLTVGRHLSCAVTAAALDAPHLIAGPKGWYHLFSRVRFAGLSHTEIDESFDERFHVYCDDEDFAREFFAGPAKGIMESAGEDFGFELHSDGLLCYAPLLAPARIEALLSYADPLAG